MRIEPLMGAKLEDAVEMWRQTGVEAYVQRSDSRPAYAKAAAISDRART
jgi:hypothetical protein